MSPSLKTRLLIAITATLTISGCSSTQWNDVGQQLGTSAAGQIFAFAFGGNGCFENLTDEQIEQQRIDSLYPESMTREAMLESNRVAARWERYDDHLAKTSTDSND